jgi:hypothetical protein
MKNYPIILCADKPSEALSFRVQQAVRQYEEVEAGQTTNGDEVLEIDRGGTVFKTAVFSKSLPHNSRGEVSEANYDLLLAAIEEGTEAAFATVPQGGTRKLVNPRAPRTFTSMGVDHFGLTMPPPPAMTSREAASELAEIYEHALNRDATFALLEDSGTPDTDADRAVSVLNTFGGDFKGPKIGGVVTRKSLFRGAAEGCTLGPYISQFLYHDIPYGAGKIEQKYNDEAAVSHGTTLVDYLALQNGTLDPDPDGDLTGTYKYIHTPRVLGSYVHRDPPFQSALGAALILLAEGAPFDPSNPLVTNTREAAFITHGPVGTLTAVTAVAEIALKAAWTQKWHWHRRIRPEAMACRVHHQDIADTDYGIHADLMSSATLTAIKAFNVSGTALLPLQYPEGCPAHPAYAAGHATFAGACVTVLKAIFDGTTPITSLLTVMHSTDGSTLTPYGGSTAGMTVNTELNKLAANIALGRNSAGVHYRSDGDDSMELGERVAIAYLKDLAQSYVRENDTFAGFTLRKFDGTTITIK